MPPMDPNRTLDQFQKRLAMLDDLYLRTYADVQAGSNALDLRKGLAADFAFRLGGEWELFQHRWHIAAISKVPKKFVTVIQNEIDDALKGDLKSHLAVIRKDSTVVPAHPTVNQIEQFVDPRGFNVTFDTTLSWVKRSDEHLDTAYVDKVRSIHKDQTASSCLDLLRAVRNRLAHGSDGSGSRLNTFVRERPKGETEGLVGAVNKPLVRPTKKIDDVAVYLHGTTGKPPQQRVLFLSQRVRGIAEMLRV